MVKSKLVNKEKSYSLLSFSWKVPATHRQWHTFSFHDLIERNVSVLVHKRNLTFPCNRDDQDN